MSFQILLTLLPYYLSIPIRYSFFVYRKDIVHIKYNVISIIYDIHIIHILYAISYMLYAIYDNEKESKGKEICLLQVNAVKI